MPSETKRNVQARLSELLNLTPSHPPGKTAMELCQELNELGFRVSKRTVERDIKSLSEIHPGIICNDKSEPYGWYWATGSTARPGGMSLPDALSLQLVERTIRPLLPSSILQVMEPRFKQAAAKLNAHKITQTTARWLDKIHTIPQSLPVIPPRIEPVILDTVQSAVLNETKIEIEYQAVNSKATKTHVLNPIALGQRGAITYLLATKDAYRTCNDVIVFAVHRIKQAHRLATPIPNIDNRSDLVHCIKTEKLQFGEGRPIKVRLAIDETLAHIHTETPLSADQTIEKCDGKLILTATLINSWALQWWILSKGPSVTVLSPESLKTKIKSLLKNALNNYD